MKHMLFVYLDDLLELSPIDEIAKLHDVELVYELAEHNTQNHPDFVVITRMAHTVQTRIEDLCPGARIYIYNISREQPHIIGVDDIPGPVPSGAKLKAAPPAVITSADIPGPLPSPAMRPAVVHHNFSSQAGMASFAGIGGMQHLAVLGD